MKRSFVSRRIFLCVVWWKYIFRFRQGTGNRNVGWHGYSGFTRIVAAAHAQSSVPWRFENPMAAKWNGAWLFLLPVPLLPSVHSLSHASRASSLREGAFCVRMRLTGSRSGPLTEGAGWPSGQTEGVYQGDAEPMSLSYERTGWKKGNRGWRKKGRSRRKTRTERGIDENRHSKQADR